MGLDTTLGPPRSFTIYDDTDTHTSVGNANYSEWYNAVIVIDTVNHNYTGYWFNTDGDLLHSHADTFSSGTGNIYFGNKGDEIVTDNVRAYAGAECPTGILTNDTGGTITYDGDYAIHTFTSGGTYTPSVNREVEVLVVGGGGGGGAGGLIHNTSYITGTSPITVTVGAGGLDDLPGANSVFGTLTAIGGGEGGGEATFGTYITGQAGGSGGGGTSLENAGGAGTAGQGYSGGTGGTEGIYHRAGGGGGASEAGKTDTGGVGSDGGDGLLINISGSDVYYAGGGGGGGNAGTIGYGGLGGGGNSGANTGGDTGEAGTPNTGGGGGGGGGSATRGHGGAGGSGIVIIRYNVSESLEAEVASPSDHKTETTTKQQQTTNVSLDSTTFTNVYSYRFTPENSTEFYQTFTVPVNPTKSNGLQCLIHIDGA